MNFRTRKNGTSKQIGKKFLVKPLLESYNKPEMKVVRNHKFMELDVENLTTGKPIHIDFSLGKLPLNIQIPNDFYKVVYTNKAINGDRSIGGMNYFAAKSYGYKFPYPSNVVQIAQQTTNRKGDGYRNRREKLLGTIAHEIIEAELMRQFDLPYEAAHICAMEYENGIHHHTGRHGRNYE